MTEEERLEGNKLIAEFMGGEFIPNGIHSFWQFPDNNECYTLTYDKSWDLLMPVAIKIRGVLQNNELHAKLKTEWHMIELALCVCCIESLHMAILIFIRNYNQQTK